MRTDGQQATDGTFKPPPPTAPTSAQVFLLFAYHVLLGIVLAYSIYNVWPPQPWPGDYPDPVAASGTTTGEAGSAAAAATVPAPNATASRPAYTGPKPPPFSLFGKQFQPSLEVRLILMVLLAGAIGSYIHASSSFVDYLGNRTLISSWVWWYLLRPFIGMMLALLFYFVFRGGFITAGATSDAGAAANFINPFGVAALAGLVGMFSKVATDKLNEVFTTLFRPSEGDSNRGDKLGGNPAPSVVSFDPKSGPTTGGKPVVITGTNFLASPIVTFDGLPANVVTATDKSITVTTPAHPAPGPVPVEVVNSDGQKTTAADAYTYEEVGNGGGGEVGSGGGASGEGAGGGAAGGNTGNDAADEAAIESPPL